MADFEDFRVGATITTMWRTIAEADMLGFVQLTGLFEELWLDAGNAVAAGLSAGRLVPGYLTLSFAERSTPSCSAPPTSPTSRRWRPGWRPPSAR